jgi:sulfate adenylyltransferase subunit 1
METPTKDILRFITCGSVDDGKSTLIGRLLYDTKTLFEDQLEAIEATSKRRGEEHVNLALLTDGLKAEREQGITIDVAYRYFATPHRKFIMADTPGHVQYTRNMVTGASNAQLAIVLIDARHGVVEQTRRHTFIASLMDIRHIVVAVNKMDLVDWSEAVFNKIKSDFKTFASKLDIADLRFVPISALHGDNVVDRSEHTPWYKGPSMLYVLENVVVNTDTNKVDCRFPVQYVIRPMREAYHDFRGYAGQISSGVFKPGDTVTALPSGFSTQIDKIYVGEAEVEEAFPPMSVCMTLKDDIDISRGDMVVKSTNLPETAQELDLMICWLNPKPLQPGGKYGVRHTTQDTRCILQNVLYKVNIQTLHREEQDTQIGMNDIGRIRIRTAKPVFADKYKQNRATGSLIIYDEFSNEVLAAGMIL